MLLSGQNLENVKIFPIKLLYLFVTGDENKQDVYPYTPAHTVSLNLEKL